MIQPLKMVPWETNNMVLSRNRSPNYFDNLINLNAEKFDEQSKILGVSLFAGEFLQLPSDSRNTLDKHFMGIQGEIPSGKLT